MGKNGLTRRGCSQHDKSKTVDTVKQILKKYHKKRLVKIIKLH